MDPYPGDDWFDSVMLFLANWARPAAKEWFTLLEWMLILSAVAFVAKKVANPLYQVAFYASSGVLGVYLFIGYQSLWHGHFSKILPASGEEPTLRTFLVRSILWALGASAAWGLAAFVATLAHGFATELTDILNA